ncbi:MAG TPA: Zn-dependent alcohol dehydrogenase, partial [Dehalococcoidia bacterium]|nr:Zn-dependent alcohol dehydrogenase [Dehalococcoidia bacterium]
TKRPEAVPVDAAVLYQANAPLQVRSLSQDPPKHGEVLVRMGAAGVCASDYHVIHGTARLPLPAVLGHEGAGTVEAVGPGVTSVQPGQRCILSFISNCGHCHQCRSGHPQLCDTNAQTGASQFDGTVRLHDDDGNDVFQMAKLGVFAQKLVAPAQACFPIPDEVPIDVAALIGCCVTTGAGGVFHQPGMRPGASVAVIGCGGVGLNTVQAARIMNASQIIAVDVHDHKLEFSRGFGATDVVNSRTTDAVAAIKELSGGGVDFAFDTFGSADTSRQAVEALRKNGHAVVIGLAPLEDRAPIDLVDMVRNQKTLVGSYYGSASPHETFNTLVGLYVDGRIEIDSLIRRRYPLGEINEAFDALGRGEDGRGVIMFE